MKRWYSLPLLGYIFSVVLCGLNAGAADVEDTFSPELAKRIQPLIDAHSGDVGVAIKNLEGPGSFSHRGDSAMATASLIKLPLMVATYQQIDRGDLAPDTRIVLHKKDKVPGSGILTKHLSAGLTMSLVDAIRLMIRYSDNTATNLVVDQAGLDATAKAMESLGLPETKLHSKVYRGDTTIYPERSKRYGLGSTSADEMVRLLEKLHRKEVASEQSCEAMIEHLLTCDDEVKIKAGLPRGTKVAHKTGAVSRSRTDAGIVYGPGAGNAFAICVLTGNNEDRSWSPDSAPHQLIAKIAGEAFDVFYGEQSGEDSGRTTPLQAGAFGKLVEAVQRTLNKRLKPSPALSIDGDFGPATKAAVVRFQESKGLEADGIVDEETFAALGTLIENDDAVPPPAQINGNWPKKQPKDTLQGVPFVTAKAWVMIDGATGEKIAGAKENESRPMASATKLMTAFVVSELAKRDSTVWDQTVTFSRRADETVGSTSAIRAGESLSVKDLMYGLMLPSGNDASVAFAEHFGDQPDLLRKAFGDQQWEKLDSYQRFIVTMNLAADDLDLGQTNFVNPHGLTEEGHRASASDLARLAMAALKRPEIAEVVSTPQYGVTVNGTGGYKRNLAWYNTNRLLKIEGYQGVKTGTTSAAGACLIAKGTRQGKERFIVVLGSASSAARYSDTRNLFRWGWNEHP